MHSTQKQSTKRKSSEITGDSNSRRRVRKKQKLQTVDEMEESVQENTSLNTIRNGKLSDQLLLEARVSLDKHAVENYFSSTSLRNARVETDNDISDVNSMPKKQQKQTTLLYYYKILKPTNVKTEGNSDEANRETAVLLEVVSVKQKPGTEQPVFLEYKPGPIASDVKSNLLLLQDMSQAVENDMAVIFEDGSSVKSEYLDAMISPVNEQLPVNSDACEIDTEDLLTSIPECDQPEICNFTHVSDTNENSDIDVENFSGAEADESVLQEVNVAPKKRKYAKKSKYESKVGTLPAQIFRCDDCSYKTRTKPKIQLHILTEHGSDLDIAYCSKCGNVFEKLYALQRHRAFCGLLAYKCKYCEKSWTTSSVFIRRHLQLEHSKELGSETIDKVYEEMIIARRTCRENLLKSFQENSKATGNTSLKAITNDDNVKRYCWKCNKKFDIERKRRGKTTNNCPECHSVCKFQCLKCDKLFLTCSSAKQHWQNICNPQKYFKCDQCDLKFNIRSKLILHQQSHKKYTMGSLEGSMTAKTKTSAETGTASETRQKSTLSQGNFKGRKQERTFHCNECDHEASKKTEIQLHILTEHGSDLNIPYCSKCGAVFKLLHKYQQHLLFCGKFKYKCKFCPESWTYPKHVKDHLMSRHSHEFGSNTVHEIYDEMSRQVRTSREQLLKSAGKNAGATEGGLSSILLDEKIKLYCWKCDKKFDIVRMKRSKIAMNCPDCNLECKFQCLKCEKLFPMNQNARDHVRFTCDPQRSFKCGQCNFVTYRQFLLFHHQKTHSVPSIENLKDIKTEQTEGDNLHPRNFMLAQTRGTRRTGKHAVIPKSNQTRQRVILYCNECDYKTIKKRELQVHILNEHGSDLGVLHCSKCGTVFRSPHKLQKHKLTCCLVEYKCLYCPESWLHFDTSIRFHLNRQHANEFGCKTVDDVYKEILLQRRRNLDECLKSIQEKAKATGSNEYTGSLVIDDKVKLYCKNCNKKYDLQSAKRIWNRIEKSCPDCKSDCLFQCCKCGKNCPSAESARIHIRVICEPQQYFQCSYCDFRTKHESSAILHEKLHKSEESFKKSDKHYFSVFEGEDATKESDSISAYTKMSAKSETRGASKRIAQGRTYHCADCDYFAYRKEDIKSHIMKEHVTDLETRQCPKCSKCFETSHTYQRHVNVCGSVEFQCEYCPKKWAKLHRVPITTHLLSQHSKELGSTTVSAVLTKISRKGQEMKVNILKSKIKKQTDDENVGKSPTSKFTVHCKKCERKLNERGMKGNDFLKPCPHCAGALVFKCTKCSKSFKWVTSARQHAREICYPEKVFACEYCVFVTMRRQGLRDHVLIVHPGQRPTKRLKK